MSNYDKPMILADEELAEGVYAAGSGPNPGTGDTSGTSWALDGPPKIGEYRQDDYSPNPGHYYVNVPLTPGTSNSCTVTLTFNGTINSAVIGSNSKANWSLNYSGSIVTATLIGELSGSGYDQLELYVKTQNDNPTCSVSVN